jgi:putative transposase
MDVLAVCLMPNHFHHVVRSYSDRDLGQWMQWLLTFHARHYHHRYRSNDHVWQGRFQGITNL